MKAYYSGAQIIDEALAGIGDFNREYRMDAAMHFMRGYRDFALFNSFQVKEVWLEVNALNYTVKMPEDCLRVDEIGVSIAGEIFTFTESSHMVSPSDATNRELLASRGEDENIVRTPSSGYGTKGANLEYYYKVDERKRRIILNRLSVDQTRFPNSTEVLLKYVSNDIDDLNEARIGGDAANMLITYVEWKVVQALPEKFNRFYRADKKLDFEEAEAKYRILLIPSVQEMMDVIYETSSQNVRL